MRKHIVKEVDQKYDSMNETKQAFYKYGSNVIIEESANMDDLNEQSSRRFSSPLTVYISPFGLIIIQQAM